jgi:hypothetical protein
MKALQTTYIAPRAISDVGVISLPELPFLLTVGYKFIPHPEYPSLSVALFPRTSLLVTGLKSASALLAQFPLYPPPIESN